MSNININHLNDKASIHNKIKDVKNSTTQIKPSYYFSFWKLHNYLRLLLLHWGKHLLKALQFLLFCLVCPSKIFIISWCCFLDWCSRLPSTSTRCFCSCNSSSLHFWTRTFFFFSQICNFCQLHSYDFFCFSFAFSSVIFIALPFLCFAQAL